MSTDTVPLGQWLASIGLGRFEASFADVGCNELSDLLFVESLEVLLDLVPELCEPHNKMAQIKIMKSLRSQSGWLGDPKLLTDANDPQQKKGKFEELDLLKYKGLLNSGFSIPVFVVILAVMKQGLLPLDRSEMLAVMNVVWAAVVKATCTLYMAPGDSRLIAAVLARLFPQMHRQKGFKGFDVKLVDFMQNVRQNKIKSLEVPNSPEFSEILDMFPDKATQVVDSVDTIGVYKRTIYENTVRATLVSADNAKGSEARATKVHMAALQAMLGTELGKLLDQECVDLLSSMSLDKVATSKPTEGASVTDDTPGPTTTKQGKSLSGRSKGTPASAAAAKPTTSHSEVTSNEEQLKRNEEQHNERVFKAVASMIAEKQSTTGTMVPRCRVEGGDSKITAFLTKSLVASITPKTAPVAKVAEHGGDGGGTAELGEGSTSTSKPNGKRTKSSGGDKDKPPSKRKKKSKASDKHDEEKDRAASESADKDRPESESADKDRSESESADKDRSESESAGKDGSDNDDDWKPGKVLVARTYNGKQQFLVHWKDCSAKLKDLTWEHVDVMNATKEGKAAKKTYVDWAKKQDPPKWPPVCGINAMDYCEADEE